MDAYKKAVQTAVAKQLANKLNVANVEHSVSENIAAMQCNKTVNARNLCIWAETAIVYMLDDDEALTGDFTLVDLVAVRDNAAEIVQYLKQ